MASGFGLTREPSADSLSGGCDTSVRSVASTLTGPESGAAAAGAAAASAAEEEGAEAFDFFAASEEEDDDDFEGPPLARQE